MDRTTRTTTQRARKALAVAGAGAALAALVGCNPLDATPTINANSAIARFQYDGPGDVWFEAAVTGTEGFTVQFLGAVHVPDYATTTEVRRCRNNVNLNIEEPCGDYPEFPYTKQHHTAGEAPGTYWPMIVLHPGDQFQVVVYCSQGGAARACPDTTKVHVRTSGSGGALVGDLTSIPAFGRA